MKKDKNFQDWLIKNTEYPQWLIKEWFRNPNKIKDAFVDLYWKDFEKEKNGENLDGY